MCMSRILGARAFFQFYEQLHGTLHMQDMGSALTNALFFYRTSLAFCLDPTLARSSTSFCIRPTKCASRPTISFVV